MLYEEVNNWIGTIVKQICNTSVHVSYQLFCYLIYSTHHQFGWNCCSSLYSIELRGLARILIINLVPLALFRVRNPSQSLLPKSSFTHKSCDTQLSDWFINKLSLSITPCLSHIVSLSLSFVYLSMNVSCLYPPVFVYLCHIVFLCFVYLCLSLSQCSSFCLVLSFS